MALLGVIALGPAMAQLFSPSVRLVDAVGYTFYQAGSTSPTYGLINRFTALAVVALSVYVMATRRSRRIEPIMLSLVAFAAIRASSMATGYAAEFNTAAALFLAASLALRAPRISATEALIAIRWVSRILTVGSLTFFVLRPDAAAFFFNERTVFGLPQLAGLAPHPNVLGPFAVVAAALELHTASRFRIAWAIPAVICVILANSRTAYIGLVIGVVVVCLRFGSRQVRGALLAAAVVCTVTAASWAIVSPRSIAAAVSRLVTDNTISGNGRSYIWQVAYQEFLDHPVFGYGLSVFNETYRLNKNLPAAGQAHNQLLQSLAEGGAVGAVSLLLLVVTLGLFVFRSASPLLVFWYVVLLCHSIYESPFRGVLGIQSFLILALFIITASVGQGGRASSSNQAPSVAATPNSC